MRASFQAIKAETVAFAAALGAGGVGLMEIVGRFVDVARETGRVTTALKNVSGGMAQYADNLSYITQLAKQYGLEVNALTGNFAKFTATADISGMSLANQRKIFESLSRACTAFGLSADQTNHVFTALSQMMSKGKISSEELRQQMGEQLPIALQAMAKAAGVSMAGLDKLLKEGKLMSADVLPKFAEALNEMIPDVSTDNLEASVNRLKNTFTELVNSSGVQGFYKSTVELLDGLLQRARESITGIVAFVASLIGLKLVANIAGYFQKINGIVAGAVDTHRRAEEQKLLATEKRVKAAERLEVAQTAYEKAQDTERLAAYDKVEKAKAALARATANERKATLAAQAAAERAAALQGGNLWTRMTNRIKLAWAGVATAAKGALSAIGTGALISGISAAVSALANMVAEWRRIRNAYDDYRSRMEQAARDNTEVIKLQSLLELMNDRSRTQEEINGVQNTLQSMLGAEKLTQEEINKRVKARISLLKEAALAEQAATEYAQADSKNRQLLRDTGFSQEQMQSLIQLREESVKPGNLAATHDYFGAMKDFRKANGGRYNILEEYKLDNAVAEYAQNLRILSDASRNLAEHQAAAAKLQVETTVTVTGGDGADEKDSELEKQQKRYEQSLRELNARKEVEKLSTDEYNKALDELNRSSLIAAKATGDREVLESQYLKGLQQTVDKQDYNPTMEKLYEVQAEYAEAEQKAKAKLDARLITEEQYREALAEAATFAALAAVSIDGIGTAAQDFVEKMRGVVAANMTAVEMPTLKSRDTTFDYKKSDTDIQQENLNIWVEYRDNLGEKLEEARRTGSDLAGQLEQELNAAIANVESLEDALKLAEVQEDIEQFKAQLAEGVYSSVKGVANNADRMVSAFRNISEVLNDVDASPWEKILSVWNAMVQAVVGIISIARTIENVSSLMAKLSGAQQSSKDIIAGKAAEVAANQVATAMEITMSRQKAEAAAVEMAAKSTAAYAGIPFVGAGLAAAQIAAMTAMIQAARAAIPKFANGGIVTGGPASGDKILARVNAGEMILNPAQQSNLFRMLNEGKGSEGSRNEGVFIGFDRVRGSDIYLALKNYMKSTGKKL